MTDGEVLMKVFIKYFEFMLSDQQTDEYGFTIKPEVIKGRDGYTIRTHVFVTDLEDRESCALIVTFTRTKGLISFQHPQLLDSVSPATLHKTLIVAGRLALIIEKWKFTNCIFRSIFDDLEKM